MSNAKRMSKILLTAYWEIFDKDEMVGFESLRLELQLNMVQAVFNTKG